MKTLKQLTVLILFLSGLMTTGCDRKENAPPPEPPTINVTDSLVMVDLYHSTLVSNKNGRVKKLIK